MVIHPEKLQKLGQAKVKKFVSTTELVLYAWFGLWSLAGYFFTSSASTMTFCYNQSAIFLDTLTHHTQPDRTVLEKLSKDFTLASLQLLAVWELLMYIRIFQSLKTKDEKLKKNIGKEMFRMRTKRNIISLSGQALGFGIELMSMVIVQVIARVDSDSPFLQLQMTTIFVIIQGSLLSVVHFMTSPDMRKFYLKFEI